MICTLKSVANMSDESFKIDLKEVKQDLQRAIVEFSQRGLLHSTKW